MKDIAENHAYEQFFFSDATRARLVKIARQHRHPLLLCTPTIAQELDAVGHPYTLLDRDRRFAHLKGYERFDLRKPHMVFGSFDAIIADPPFSNVSLPDLKRTIDLLAQGTSLEPALYLCFINGQEGKLLSLFSAYRLERCPPSLGYRSVKAATQARIFLYGPR